ncbi:hypothetical protein Peur_025164 [Populus x canadensis]
MTDNRILRRLVVPFFLCFKGSFCFFISVPPSVFCQVLAWCSISPFQHQKKNNWECRKMCLISGNSCCGACEIQLPFRLRLSIPYEVGYSTLDRFTVGIRTDKEIRNRIAVVLKHCLGADD